MDPVREIRIAAPGIRSLVWDKDSLVDWVDGGQRYGLDGHITPRAVRYSHIFDAAITSPSGDYVVIYARLGTKGLVLHRGVHVREINRSYYHSDAYEYPVTMVRLPDGREALVHCPDNYNQLEIDDLETGERLTCGDRRDLSDFFHSRLDSPPGGKYMVSAGWMWHPVDDVRAYDLHAALNDPSRLDGHGVKMTAWADESSAAFLDDGKLAVVLRGIEGDETDHHESDDQRVELRIFDLHTATMLSCVPLDRRAGTIMAIGDRHLLALHGSPRLIELATGKEIQTWPHIDSGTQTSSILSGEKLPPMAFDHDGQRCAIADSSGITVLHF